MGWGRNRNRQQNIRDYSKVHAMQRVREKMHNRWLLLAPFTLDAKKIYRAMFTREERTAMRVLNKSYPSMLNVGCDFAIDWDIPMARIPNPLARNASYLYPKFLHISFPKDVPVPVTATWHQNTDRLRLSRLDSETYAELCEWAARWMKLSAETNAVVTKLDTCFDICNTMGQVKRLWPNLVSFLPERAQQVLREAKVQSRYPEAVLVRGNDWDEKANNYKLIGLREEWSPPALRPYDLLITEALMMPDSEEEEDFTVKVEFGVGCD